MPTIEKQRRMDLRLTERQRLTYERAAALRGQTLTQWATAHLDESSARDIAEASTTYLSPDGFDAFCEMLDSPCPKPQKRCLTVKRFGNEHIYQARSTPRWPRHRGFPLRKYSCRRMG